MRAVVQRVRRATVRVDEEVVGAIGEGLLVYLAVGRGDGDRDLEFMVDKVAGLRIFPDEHRPMNRSVAETGGSVLVVSQFTLFGDCRRGKRPAFLEAAEPGPAEQAVERFVKGLSERGLHTETGRFRATMQVEAVNDGPVTILLDSKKLF